MFALHHLRFLVSAIVVFVAMTNSLIADDAVDYNKHIKPLLRGRCVTCHGALRQRGTLRLDTVGMMLKGGESGVAIRPSDAAKSLLIKRITAVDKADRMPPEGEALSADEIKLLKNWIDQGATGPTGEKAERDPKLHWAYSKPARAKLPAVQRAEWNAHPIDAFIARRHAEKGLSPNPVADKSTLLRRVYIDLIGLPPTPAQLAYFLADDSSDAYAKVVSGLLMNPHHGERWGRHWMDVWRYSDWYGYRAELRNSARHMWRWRDWIVESLNEDRSYADMIVQMLAADEVSPQDRDSLRATGFLARHYYLFNRNTWMETAIEHTGKAFLGLTFNCARCHDHMYDPISQKEYYQFRAIFAPYQVRTDAVVGQPDVTKDGLSLAYDLNLNVKTFLFKRGNDKYPDKHNPLDATVPEFFTHTSFEPRTVNHPPEFWYPGLRKNVQTELLKNAENKIVLAKTNFAKASDFLDKASTQQKSVKPGSKKQADSAIPKQASKQESLKPFLVDDFSKKQAHWEFGPGKWEIKNNTLVQSEVGPTRRSLTSKSNHPTDFSATFRVKILGGQMWKSAGLSFDSNNRNSQTIYLSAYAGGSKVQYSYQVNQKITFPANAAKLAPINIGQLYELRIDVRGTLLNAYIDGHRILAVELALPRAPGRFELWAFDAHAEFHSVKVAPLADSVQLVAAATTPTKKPKLDTETDVRLARAKLTAAKAHQETALAELVSLKARIDAENQKYADKKGQGDSEETVKQKLDELTKSAASRELDAQLKTALETIQQIGVQIIETDNNPKLAGKAKTDALAKLKKDKLKLEATVKKLRAKSQSPTSTYAVLSKQHPKVSSGRRTALARWIANKDNPLTARVAVNHVWMRHFGEPLVSSVFDFGMNGKPPSHPELLDWLAVEFMNSGWSMRHLHQLIVTSRTYRLSSRGENPKNLMIDPDNQFRWRSNTRRMESEIVRDCILASSGQLDRKFGGPEAEAKLGDSTFRRSIYYRHAPEKLMPFLELFDTASTDECYRRNDTVAPQQALALVNSRLALEQSRHLAARLSQPVADGTKVDDTEFVTSLFRTLLIRDPSSIEAKACSQFLKMQTRQFQAPAKLSKFSKGPKLSVPPSKDAHQRARENLAHAVLNHNDFVTVR
jgi:hypothetical protein